MGRPRACTIACSLLLFLSVCSEQSIAADRPAAVARAAETLTATVMVRGQSQFVAFADIIAPNAAHTPGVASGFLFAKPAWLMPPPDFLASMVLTGNNSKKARSHAATVATAAPTNFAPDDFTNPTTLEQDSEPFGIQTVRARPGLLWVKWHKVQRAIKTEAPALARCLTTPSRCSPAAARFVAIIKKAAQLHGRARLELVNQRVNSAIHYVTDMEQWHQLDHWSAPLDQHHRGSFDTGMGDCEDYAIAKYAALLDAGTPARDLQLLMVRDRSVHSYHAVLAARLNGQWLLLDNRWQRLIRDSEAQFLRPLYALNSAGVERFAAAHTNNHQAPVKRIARMPDWLILAGKLDPAPASA